MNQNRVISTAVLLLLLATTIPAFAQKGEEEKGGGKAAPAERQAQPQRAPQAQQKAQPQHAQPAQQSAQPQHIQQAQQKVQPQRAPQAQQKQQPQRVQQTQQPARQKTETVANNRGGGQYGRISNANYGSHFGQGHSFRMIRPQMIGGYNRFQYGGYWFGFNQGWPTGWSYNDTVYVVYEGGGYYLCDLRFPGIQITLNMF